MKVIIMLLDVGAIMIEDSLKVIGEKVISNNTSVLERLSGYLTPVIAILAVIIAYQQFKINKQRFLFETYEKRLKIFDGIQEFLFLIMQNGQTNYDELRKYTVEASETIFLFDKEVKNKVEEIYQKAVEMISLQDQLCPRDGSPGLPVGEQRNKVAKEQSNYLKWFICQNKTVKQLFSNKMSLR